MWPPAPTKAGWCKANTRSPRQELPEGTLSNLRFHQLLSIAGEARMKKTLSILVLSFGLAVWSLAQAAPQSSSQSNDPNLTTTPAGQSSSMAGGGNSSAPQ